MDRTKCRFPIASRIMLIQLHINLWGDVLILVILNVPVGISLETVSTDLFPPPETC